MAERVWWWQRDIPSAPGHPPAAGGSRTAPTLRPLTLREGDLCKTSRTDSRWHDLRGIPCCRATPDGGSVCWSAGLRGNEVKRRALLILGSRVRGNDGFCGFCVEVTAAEALVSGGNEVERRALLILGSRVRGNDGFLGILGSGVRGNDGFCSTLGTEGISARNRMFGMIKLRLVSVNAPWADVLMNAKSYKEM